MTRWLLISGAPKATQPHHDARDGHRSVLRPRRWARQRVRFPSNTEEYKLECCGVLFILKGGGGHSLEDKPQGHLG